MAQQINLYLAQYPPKPKLQIRGPLALFVGILVMLVSGSASIGYLKLHALQQDLLIVQQAQAIKQTNLKRLLRIADETLQEDQLRQQVSQLESQLAEKRELMRQLERQTVKMSKGLSENFIALARRDLPGVWLNEIQFTAGGDEVLLKGQAEYPELVTDYMAGLAQESIFQGMQFVRFESAAINEQTDLSNFELISQAPAEGRANER